MYLYVPTKLDHNEVMKFNIIVVARSTCLSTAALSTSRCLVEGSTFLLKGGVPKSRRKTVHRSPGKSGVLENEDQPIGAKPSSSSSHKSLFLEVSGGAGGVLERGNNGISDIIAPLIFAVLSAVLISTLYNLRDLGLPALTFGMKALTFVTGDVAWDHIVIAFSSFFFRGIDPDNEISFQ